MERAECCVQGCAGSNGKLYRFPLDAGRSREWREKLGMGFVDGGASKRLKVCGKHFSVEQYEGSNQNKPLKPNAIPDCFIPKIKQEADAIVQLNNNEEIPLPPKLLDDRIKEDTFEPPPLVELENLDKMCRLCLETDDQGTHQSVFDTTDIVSYIQQSIGIEIDESDPYPHQICPVCIERVNYIQRSREWFLKNDQLLRTLVDEPASTSSSHDMIIPDLVPEHPSTSASAPETIFFKEESTLAEEYFEDSPAKESVEISSDDDDPSDEEFLVTPGGRPKRLRQATTSIAAIRKSWEKQAKKPAKNRRPNSFCTICSREFESPRDLRNHLYASHQGVVCKHCGVAYAHPGTLELHIKKVHAVKEPLLEGKEQAVQNLFREMAEKFNGGVVLSGLGGGAGSGAAAVEPANSGTGSKNSGSGISTRPKRQRTSLREK